MTISSRTRLAAAIAATVVAGATIASVIATAPAAHVAAQATYYTVQVPNVVGMHYSGAEAALSQSGGLVGLAAADQAACHDTRTPGRWDVIVGQSPAAGATVDRGSVVVIFEAGGPPC